MEDKKFINVFIASPSDLSEERRLFPEIMKLINDSRKNQSLPCHLEPLGWEDALPGQGRPQEIINKDVENCDIFIMLLWKKWGTPTEKFTSGTEEEYTIARERFKKSGSPHMSIYFRSVPDDMMADQGDQLKKVLEFRTKIETERTALFKTYNKPADWKDLLVTHINQILDRTIYGKDYGTFQDKAAGEVSPELAKSFKELEEKHEENKKHLKTAQDKLKQAALDYALKAKEFIKEGKFTSAEEMFVKSIDLYEEPEVLNSYGLFLYQIGDLDRAVEKFEKMLNIFKSPGILANAYGNLGNVYVTRGELVKAKEMHNKALKMNTELGRKEGMANAYCNLGSVYVTRGDMDKAEEMCNKALKIDTESGRKEGMANAYVNLGIVYFTRGDLVKAEEMHNKALKIDTELGRKEGMATDYGNLGNVYFTREDMDKAEEMYNKALKIDTELGWKEGMTNAYGNLGVVYFTRGDLDKAEEMQNEALKMHIELGRKEGMANAYGNLGSVYITRGNTDKAKEMWLMSIKLFKKIGNQGMVKKVQGWLDSLK